MKLPIYLICYFLGSHTFVSTMTTSADKEICTDTCNCECENKYCNDGCGDIKRCIDSCRSVYNKKCVHPGCKDLECASYTMCRNTCFFQFTEMKYSKESSKFISFGYSDRLEDRMGEDEYYDWCFFMCIQHYPPQKKKKN